MRAAENHIQTTNSSKVDHPFVRSPNSGVEERLMKVSLRLVPEGQWNLLQTHSKGPAVVWCQCSMLS